MKEVVVWADRARERQREGERWKEKVAAVPRQSRCTGEREPSATN